MNHCSIAYTFYDIDFRVRRYAETFAGQGNRVEAITLQAQGHTHDEIIDGVKVFRIKKREREERGIWQYVARLFTFLIRSAFHVTWRHLKYRYDIIHVHNVPDFLVFAAIFPKMMGAKVILDIHDILPEFYAQKFGVAPGSFPVQLLKIVERLSVRFADYVIVANDLWREKLISRNSLNPEKCLALLNYPNLKFFENVRCKADRKELKIVYPGHLSYHHGIDIAIRSMSIIRKTVPNATLELYASSALRQFRQFLEDLIDELELRQSVRFHPSVGLREIALVYQDVSMGIVPKRGGVFASEAFSTKIFDFFSAGVPIVASRTKVDEYYFDDSMIAFFQPENHEDMARCILELHRDPSRRRAMAEKGLQFVKENNWDVKKQNYVDVVNTLRDRKSGIIVAADAIGTEQ